MPENSSIAIIGMGAIFPKSNGLQQYWRLLLNGEDAISDIPEETHWSLQDYFDENPATPDHTYCKKGGFIPKVNFDPARYSLPPNNIEATDTSQLLGLMVAEMALEDAGYPVTSPGLDKERTNIILGVTGTQELVIPLGARLYHPFWKKALEESGITDEKREEILERISGRFPQWQENSFPGLLGNVVAGRIANRLDLGGTNSVVDAACASSLSAVHTACLELLSGRCDISITGGVDALNDIFMHMCFSKTGVLSHTSDARPFSKDADGTVLGEGVGMLVLKRLEDAEQDNDRIYAVIRGMGTSSDGKTGGIYAPDATGQLRALKSAYGQAEIDPATVELFEAHGTGTRVGDKIEFSALKQLVAGDKRKNRTAVGSVKSMIGHAKAAAGVAGLIKAVLGLHHKVLPPTLKAANPDPELAIEESPFYLNNLSKPWLKSLDHPRRSGVSAFGFGGSNFHVVLEEYHDKKQHVSWDGTVQIAAFSHGTMEGLHQKIKGFQQDMETSAQWDSKEQSQMLAWHTGESRKSFTASDPFRLLMKITHVEDPVEKCTTALSCLKGEWNGDPQETINAIDEIHGKKLEKLGIFFGVGEKTGKTAFLFPGQGSQYTGMGRELLSIFPEAMETLELAEKIFHNLKISPDQSLTDLIFPPPPYVQDINTSEKKLRRTDVAQPAMGAVSLAMAKILKRFNIAPDSTCGHSFGELTALCTAGWMDDATFLELAGTRGKYMAHAANAGSDKGSMLAVKAPLKKIEQLLKQEKLNLILANRNSHEQGVLSGKTDEIKLAVRACRKHKMRGVELPVAAAFHSKLVENAAKPFAKAVKKASLTCTDTVVMSNTTGKPYPQEPAKAGKILGKQLSHPVDFIADIESMYKHNTTTFIEVGPKNVLTGLTRSILKGKNITCLPMDASSGKKSALEDLASLLCALGASGFPIDLGQWENSVDKPAKKIMRIPLTGANIKPKNIYSTQKTVSVQEKKDITVATTGSAPKHHDTSGEKYSREKAGQSVEKRSLSPLSSYSPEPGETDMKSNTFQNHENPSHASTAGNRGQSAPSMQIQSSGQQSMESQSSSKVIQTQPSSRTVQQQPWDQTAQHQAPSSHLVYSAMQLVQKGMESMQELQARTAQAHEKFLETQSTAGKTLQAMMEQTRFFAQNAMDRATHHVPYPSTASAPVQDDPPQAAAPQTRIDHQLHDTPHFNHNGKGEGEGEGGKNGSAPQINAVSFQGIESQQLHQPSDQAPLKAEQKSHFNPYAEPETRNSVAANPDPVTISEPVQKQRPDENIQLNTETETLLLETVSKLTGFPVEMLNLDMDIESDLGIDSIKRVEIVSELEKHLPGADALTPDNMGTLKTLKDIVQAIAPDAAPKSPIPAAADAADFVGTTKPTSNPAPAPHAAKEVFAQESQTQQTAPQGTANATVMEILMQTISQLTGFPVEMLTPDMDLESDLGIDSIKRVEILSNLEQQLPAAGQISPDDLGRLKTLEQIAGEISGDSTPESGNNQPGEPSVFHSGSSRSGCSTDQLAETMETGEDAKKNS